MFFVSLFVGVTIFILLLAIYGLVNKDNKSLVSKRIGQYRAVNKEVKKHNTSIWEDLTKVKYNKKMLVLVEKATDIFPYCRWIERKIAKAGIPLARHEYIYFVLISAIFWFLLVLFFTFSLLSSIMVMLLWFMVTTIYLFYLAKRRMLQFNKQLPDAIVMISNALKAGFTFTQARSIITKELGGAIGEEFSHTLQEVQLGVSLETALNNMNQRVDNADFDLMITAVLIQRQVGGNLSQIIDNIGKTIRERIKLHNEIKALTAEGILSGWVIGLLPVFLLAVMTFMNPHYFDGVLNASWGKILIIVAVISEIIGAIIIKKLVDVRI